MPAGPPKKPVFMTKDADWRYQLAIFLSALTNLVEIVTEAAEETIQDIKDKRNGDR